MQITKETIRNIEKIFEKGLQDDYLSRSIGKIIEHEKATAAQHMQSFRKDLDRFEDQYKMSSDDFFRKFKDGEIGDSEDFFEWSAIFQMYKRSLERLQMLEGTS